MTLNQHIKAERGNAARLAQQLGVSVSYISQLASGHRSVAPALAIQIEHLTAGAVTRQDLRTDWARIWPELADA